MKETIIRVIKPSVKYLKEVDRVSHIAKCARVCFGKETGNDNKTFDNLYKAKHYSMFRHASVYAIIDGCNSLDFLDEFINCPYIDYAMDSNHKVYIATNMNFTIDMNAYNNENPRYAYLIKLIKANQVSSEEFANTEIGFGMMRYTFIVNTSISVSRELNRVSPNAIAERSTRYCTANAICEPYWFSINFNYNYDVKLNKAGLFYKDADADDNEFVEECEITARLRDGRGITDVHEYFSGIISSFMFYNELINKGMLKEEARDLLPLATYTRCVYTYSIKEWRRIIDNRYFNKTGRAHPDAQNIVGKIKATLEDLGYEFM